MNKALERYLNDHLAGSSGALSLLEDLAGRQETESDRAFFLNLMETVTSDQARLERLLAEAGMGRSKTQRASGILAAKAGRLKLLWEGLEPGGLGLFEALEILALGVQGKRLRWVMLAEIAPRVWGWENVNFAELELEAIRQRDTVEERRVEAGRDLFGSLAVIDS